MRIGFDLDGVLCETPFGRLAVHAPGHVPDLPQDYERLYSQQTPGGPLRLTVEYARFGWRRASSQGAETLRRLSARHDLYIVTGRSAAGRPLVARWLRRHRLEGCVRDIRMAPPGLRPSQHKLATARMLGIHAHIDDDPRTAYYLAGHGVQHVYLYDHMGAQGEGPLPERLAVVRSLAEFAESIEAISA